MDAKDFKNSVEQIEMSEDMQNRIIRNCRKAAVHEMEETTMKKRTNYKKIVTIAAVAALCLCVSVAAAAGGQFGVYKEIKNWNGAITGGVYEQATNEIEMSVTATQSELVVTAEMLTPDVAPYSSFETFGIADYKIVDASGKVIAEGESADAAQIVEDTAVISISLDGIESGNYKLLINAFVGASKADQPLDVKGAWECDFAF